MRVVGCIDPFIPESRAGFSVLYDTTTTGGALGMLGVDNRFGLDTFASLADATDPGVAVVQGVQRGAAGATEEER